MGLKKMLESVKMKGVCIENVDKTIKIVEYMRYGSTLSIVQ